MSVESSLTVLAASTGLRVSECLGLQWQDIDIADLQMRYFRTAYPRTVERHKQDAIERKFGRVDQPGHLFRVHNWPPIRPAVGAAAGIWRALLRDTFGLPI